MKTKPLTAFVSMILFSTVAAIAAGPKWMTNLDEAKKVALKENKYLLVDFTGSDWCGYCIKLEDEVFTKPAFATFAKDYVLVRLDFPRGKKLSASEAKRNDAAKTKYEARGFPTVLVVDPKSDEVLERSVGYAPGSGPIVYLKQFEGVKKPVTGADIQKEKDSEAKKSAKGA